MKLRMLYVVFALASWLLCAGCHITPGPAPVPPDSGDSGALPTWQALDGEKWKPKDEKGPKP